MKHVYTPGSIGGRCVFCTLEAQDPAHYIEIHTPKPLLIYDISYDEYRHATQDDIDKLALVQNQYGFLIDQLRKTIKQHDAFVEQLKTKFPRKST